MVKTRKTSPEHGAAAVSSGDNLYLELFSKLQNALASIDSLENESR